MELKRLAMAAAGLLKQCQAAHNELMQRAYSEEALLAKLESEIQKLSHGTPQVPSEVNEL